MKTPQATNRAIEREAPALWAVLSDLGRAVAFPPDIPFQAAQARGKAFNATIGQVTDGEGGVVTPPALAAGLSGLGAQNLDPAVLYSPVDGIAELRERWRRRQRRSQPEDRASSRPIVTIGLSHGLSIAADLFAGPGRPVAVTRPYWGNYRQTFGVRRGARIVEGDGYRDGSYHCEGLAEALAALPEGEPAVAILNLPSNPGGYSPTVAERERIRGSLAAAAERRPLVVVCDDAYAGMVFDERIPRESMFWDLVRAHPNLVPVKVDGATKEVAFFGGRVGFLTFGVEPGSDTEGALESKIKCLIRATVGSPVATTQMVLLEALRDERLEGQVEDIRLRLERRHEVLMEALRHVDPGLLRALPCNSGCFALLELPPELGLDAETVRLALLDRFDSGLISVSTRYLRIAFCSVRSEALPELVRRTERCVAELARRVP